MLETTARESVYDGRLFSVQVLCVRDAQGGEHRREVVRHPGAVAIVPLLEEQNAPPRIVMIRNDRVAVGQRLLEVPAGKLESGEDPVDAAARELEEETGYRAARLIPLGRFYTSPGFTDELMHAFLARELTPGPARPEPGESIEVEPIDADRILKMIAAGEIVDGKSIASILMWRCLPAEAV